MPNVWSKIHQKLLARNSGIRTQQILTVPTQYVLDWHNIHVDRWEHNYIGQYKALDIL